MSWIDTLIDGKCWESVLKEDVSRESGEKSSKIFSRGPFVMCVANEIFFKLSLFQEVGKLLIASLYLQCFF